MKISQSPSQKGCSTQVQKVGHCHTQIYTALWADPPRMILKSVLPNSVTIASMQDIIILTIHRYTHFSDKDKVKVTFWIHSDFGIWYCLYFNYNFDWDSLQKFYFIFILLQFWAAFLSKSRDWLQWLFMSPVSLILHIKSTVNSCPQLLLLERNYPL